MLGYWKLEVRMLESRLHTATLHCSHHLHRTRHTKKASSEHTSSWCNATECVGHQHHLTSDPLTSLTPDVSHSLNTFGLWLKSFETGPNYISLANLKFTL